MKRFQRFVAKLHQGKKTYLAILAMACVEYCYINGHISLVVRDELMKVCGGLGAAALVAKFNRIAEAMKAGVNTYRG